MFDKVPVVSNLYGNFCFLAVHVSVTMRYKVTSAIKVAFLFPER